MTAHKGHGVGASWPMVAREIVHDPVNSGLTDVVIGSGVAAYGATTGDLTFGIVGLGQAGYGAYTMYNFAHGLRHPSPT